MKVRVLIACLALTITAACGGAMKSVTGGPAPKDSFLSKGTSKAVVHAKMPSPPSSTVKKDDGRTVEVYKITNKSEFKEEMGNEAFSHLMGHMPVVGQIPGGHALLSTASSEASEEAAKKTMMFKVTYEDSKVVEAKRIGEKG
mgnify:CR=1 FL=1